MENFVDTYHTITIYCKIVAARKSQYTEIVIEDLNRSYIDDLKYITVVVLPNWGEIHLEIGDIGYLQFQYVECGKTQWFNKETKDFEVYKYSNNYLVNFFKEKDICKQDKFDF